MSSTSSAIMTSALPRNSRPPMAAPTGPLPALPIPKTRTQSLNEPIEASSSGRSTPTLSLLPALTPKKTSVPSRNITASGLPTPRSTSTFSLPIVPTLNTTNLPTTSSSPSPPSTVAPASALPKTIRKVSSIGSFPLPPKNATRISSLPPSPLSASNSSNEHGTRLALSQKRRDSSKHRSAESGLRKPKARSSGFGVRPRQSNSNLAGSVSLLNSAGASGFIAGGEGTLHGDGHLAPPSPPQSRSSSAEGSYATDATVFEETVLEDEYRGRSAELSTADDGGASPVKKEVHGNVVVSVRVRPDAGSDASPADGEWMVDGRRSLISYKGREGGDYRYDNVFSPHDHNGRVYDNAAKRLVRRVMEGYNGTVFAYGMTGTGKTFSMQGTATSPGVIPLAITDIFSFIRENPNREFLLRVSYLEIYNEKIFDLLSPSSAQEEIKLREDSRRGVYATPLKEEIVQSPNQLLRVIAKGDQARRVGSTQFNARSSRSHAVVQIVVESRERTPSHGQFFEKESRRGDRIMPGGVLVSTLSLIDLAGSERAAENKERRQEGAHINKSLLTLGTVIARLSGDDEKGDKDESKGAEREKGLKHLPYRDSKLTRLLQPALSGNSLVSILCTIQLSSAGTSAAQTSSHTGETLNTLKFASRAKNNIVSHAKRNESNPSGGDPGSRALLDRYRMEIQDLRKQLKEQSSTKPAALTAPATPATPTMEKEDEIEEDRKREEELEREGHIRHEEQILEMHLARTALKERIGHLNRLILSSRSLGVNSGRFSSSSIPVNRMSTYSVVTDTSRPISLRSRDSLHSAHTRDSVATLEVPSHPGDTLTRTLSSGSVTTGPLPTAQTPQTMSEEVDNFEGDEDAYEVDGEDNASLTQQNRMLQADLADKNRYIATLEKRLLQARRTSHSRVSMSIASRVGSTDEPALEALVRDKDREIDELRAKLDDQTRMVTALRSAARKRDMVEVGGRRKSQQTTFSDETARPSTANGETDVVPELGSPPFRRQNSSRTSNYSSHMASTSPTATSRSSNGVTFAPIKNPLSPMAILSPTRSSMNSDDAHHHHFHHNQFRSSGGRDELRASTGSSRRKSVDEMTQLLDQMIQDKVESGLVVRGERGSLRIRHDTVIQEKLEPTALMPVTIPENRILFDDEETAAEDDHATDVDEIPTSVEAR